MPKTGVIVNLSSENGNAFTIVSKVRTALKKAGRDDLIEEFTEEATSGDYDNLLQTVMKYVEVE